MPFGPDQASNLEIAHVVFMDIVGYSRLPMDEQRAALQRLNKLVRETEAFRRSEAMKKLISLPTGDGMALVFFEDPEAPLRCAMELSRFLRDEPGMKLRMGVHSGPVYRIEDINSGINIAGGGINMAQRVMDCGDAGHILISATVADTLGQVSAWAGNLHDIGEAEVKHGVVVHLFNIYSDDYGNSEAPSKLRHRMLPDQKSQKVERQPSVQPALFAVFRRHSKAGLIALSAVTLGFVAIIASMIYSQPSRSFSSVAVLPFEYQSNDLEYLADGIPESITYSLVKLRKLSIIPHSTTLRYKGEALRDLHKVGLDLNAQALLTGKVRKGAGDNSLTITVDLIDASNGKLIWGWPFPNRQLYEISQVEQDIAQQIPDKLFLNVTPEEKALLRKGTTENPEANRLYQMGRSYWNSRSVSDQERAKAFFEQAINQDPNFARAYAKLADSLTLINVYGTPTAERMLEAKRNAEKALQIDDDLADAHTSLAYYYFRYEWNWSQAEKEFVRSLALDPDYPTAHDWYADFLDAMGRTDEAIREMKKAVEHDPAGITSNADLGLAFCYARQNDDAIKQLNKTLEMASGADDRRLAQTHNYLGLTYEQIKNFDLARGEYEKAHELDKSSRRIYAILGRGYALSGSRAKAKLIFDELSKNDDTPRFYLALLQAALGKPENVNLAFQFLNTAIARKEPGVVFLRIDPRLDNLRKDPRFESLLRGVNLSPYN